MLNEYEQNRVYAEKLAALIVNHPNMRVMAWVYTDGTTEDCYCMAGSIYDPHIETLVVGSDGVYHEKEDNPYDDCGHYYGYEVVDNWYDEEIKEKAKQIPWEEVIVFRVGVN